LIEKEIVDVYVASDEPVNSAETSGRLIIMIRIPIYVVANDRIVINGFESGNIDSEEENCIAGLSDSAWT
jgi:hypothetical protein